VPGSPCRTAPELPASARCEAYSMNTLEAVLRVSESRRSSIIPPVHDDRITPNLHIREASDADGSVFPRCIAGSAVRTMCGPPSRRRSSTGRTRLSGESPKRGRRVYTLRDRVHACTLYMLPRERSTREHKTSINDDGSDGVDRVAPTQDLSLKSSERAEKHRRYGRYRRWRGRFTVDTDDKFEHEELKMRTEKVLAKSAEGLLYQRYHARIEVDTLGRKVYEMQKSPLVPLSPLVPSGM
jgi:hypothetical protein